MHLSKLWTDVASTLPARRGNLYEQHYERKGADGRTKRYGPYYVWTRCEDGKMVSERVPRDEVPRVREEIARGQRLEDLIARLWKLAENLAREAGDIKKKRSSGSTGRRQRSLPRP